MDNDLTLPPPLAAVHLSPLNYTVARYTNHRTIEVSGGVEVPMHDLDAPYQRGSVWTDEQRRMLIRSLLEGVPTGSVVVAKRDASSYRRGNSPYRVIDGKQRITTLRMFADDEFAVPGWWFHDDDLTNPARRGSTVRFSDLSRSGSFHFNNRQVPTLEFDSDNLFLGIHPDTKERLWATRTDDEALRAEADLYLRINFGGVDQTDTDRARATRIATGDEPA